MVPLVICVALMIFAIGGYVIWPSRWNLPAHLQLGACVVAYIIPIWVVGVTRRFPPALVAADAKILAIGAAAYLAGLILGDGLPTARLFREGLAFVRMRPAAFERFLCRRATRLLFAAAVIYALCFYVMGFVPAFATEPLLAKFFKGPYAAPFHRVAYPYRLASMTVLVLLPLGFMLWYVTRQKLPAVLSLAGMVLFALALTRGEAVTGALLFAGIVAASWGRRWTIAFLLLVGLAYPVGAIVYKLLGMVRYFHHDLWQTVAAGSPDVSDQLNFLWAFLGHGQWTYGRTFFAGLLSGHNRWNPTIYALQLMNEGSSLRWIASGGLRMAPAQWGFSAFGWMGTVVVSFLSGVIWGQATRWAKTFIFGGGLLRTTVVLIAYLTIGGFLATFYVMNRNGLVKCAIVLLLVYAIGLAREDAQPVARGRPQADLAAAR